MGQLSNISVPEFRSFLTSQGLSYSHTSGGHEVWKKQGMLRPVVFQTHIEPIPEFIVRKNLASMGASRKDLLDFLNR